MTEIDLIYKKLAFIETCVQELKTLGRPDDVQLASALHNMVGFRNILVHGYEAVNPAQIEKITRHHLDDLLAFVRAIRDRLASE